MGDYDNEESNDRGKTKFKKPIQLFTYRKEEAEGHVNAAEDEGKVRAEGEANEVKEVEEVKEEQARGRGGHQSEDAGDPLDIEIEEIPIIAHMKKGGDKKKEDKPRQTPIPDRIEDYIEMLEKQVGYKVSFDVVVREMTFGDKRTALFFMNGFAKDEVLTEVLIRLTYLQPDDLSSNAFRSFLELYVPAVQVTHETDWNSMMTDVLSGASALYIDGEAAVLLIDAKRFPGRGPEEPSLERVVRGSRDGFVETLMVNVTLVRRRLRDKQLRYEIMRVGERTQTDVCIAFIDDIVDKELLKSIRDKIEQVKLDGLPLADKQLEEATVKRGWSPFPLVRYSERPDVVAAHLLEGNVAVFVDTSPSVMILPTTYFDHIQHAEENRQTPFIGTYLRWIRYFGILSSLFVLPLWFLFTLQPELKPPALSFLGAQEAGKIPMVAQFLLAEGGVDLMRLAAVHTPAPLSTAMSLVAAILIGDIAVKTGLFVNEVILYMAVAAIGMFATPSYELGLANRIVRLVLIVAVALFKVPGFMLVTTLLLIMLATERSFNRPYMWPFIPFDLKGMWNVIFRMPVLHNRTRPNLLKPQQRDKMPKAKGNG
ncbi:spore germination protein [Paenibacillus mendelii]|uniref:Spore germination protein n=1 Tax=Paenibacillus mendelii TaxID=206163 RepID=A0ABV6JHN6_9BACL|nr:spore germination protein [Paenibacillus mendelii]MCQ6558093.1 spore germination protein [Paenibacillus mendelii]